MANRFRSRVFASKGRKTFWFSGVFVEATIGGANQALLFTSLNAAALALRPFTIVRTRGFWSIRTDQQSADEIQEMAMGHIIVTDEALAIGITAVPTPAQQSGSSWFVFDSMMSSYDFESGVGVQARANRLQQYDSKAMRKVEEGQDVISVVQGGPNSDGATVNTFFWMLIKLH